MAAADLVDDNIVYRSRREDALCILYDRRGVNTKGSGRLGVDAVRQESMMGSGGAL